MFVFLNYSRTSRIFFWVNVILHQEKQEVYACLATAKEIRSECWSRSGFSKGWMVLRQQKSNTEGFPCAKKYDFGKSFVKPCSTIDNADGWFISKIGFHFPSIWMGCHVTQIQQVSWDVLSAILGSNNLNESVSDDAGRHGATLRCASQHPDDKTHGSRYRWLFCIPPCAFFFLWQAERSVSMCLPEAAACWGPEWGAFCLIVIRPDLLLLSLPPQTVSPPALWRRGWCVNSPPLRANLQLFGANTGKWPTSTFCTNDAQKKKKLLRN